MKNYLKRIIQFIILALALYYIVEELLKNSSYLKTHPPEVNISVIVGLLIIWFPYLLAPLLWGVILKRIGSSVTVLNAFIAWSLSNIAKYAPGKIWHLLGRFSLLKERASYLGESILIEVSANLSAAFFAALTARFYGLRVKGFELVFFAGSALAFIFAVYPPLLQKSLRLALKFFKKEYAVPKNLERRFYIPLILFYYVFWWLYGIGFFVFLKGMGEGGSIPLYTGIYAVAWTLGYLSFVTPGGLGVREGILIFLLKPHLSPGMPVITAILSRISIILCELFLFFLGLLLKKSVVNKNDSPYL